MNRGFDGDEMQRMQADSIRAADGGSYGESWPEPDLNGLALDDTMSTLDEMDEPSLSGAPPPSPEIGLSGAFANPPLKAGLEGGRAPSREEEADDESAAFARLAQLGSPLGGWAEAGGAAPDASGAFAIPELQGNARGGWAEAGGAAPDASGAFAIPELLGSAQGGWTEAGGAASGASGAFALPDPRAGKTASRSIINLAQEGSGRSASSSKAEDDLLGTAHQSNLAEIADLLGADAVSAMLSLSMPAVETKPKPTTSSLEKSPVAQGKPAAPNPDRGTSASQKAPAWPAPHGMELSSLPPLPPLPPLEVSDSSIELSFATSTFSVLHVAEPEPSVLPSLPPLPPLPPPADEAMTELSFATSTFDVLHVGEAIAPPEPVSEPPGAELALEVQPPAPPGLDEPLSFELEAPVEADMDAEPGDGSPFPTLRLETFFPEPGESHGGFEEEQLSLEVDQGLALATSTFDSSLTGWQEPVLPPADKSDTGSTRQPAQEHGGSFEGGTPLDMGPLIDLGPLDLPPFAPNSGPAGAATGPAASGGASPVAMAAPKPMPPVAGPPEMRAPVPLPPAPEMFAPPGAMVPPPAAPPAQLAPLADLGQLAGLPPMPGLEVPDMDALAEGVPFAQALSGPPAPGGAGAQESQPGSSLGGGLQLSADVLPGPPSGAGVGIAAGSAEGASQLLGDGGPLTLDHGSGAASGARSAPRPLSGQSGAMRAVPNPGGQGALDPPFVPMASTGGRAVSFSPRGATARESGPSRTAQLALEQIDSAEGPHLNRTGLRLMAQGLAEQNRQAAARREHHTVALHEPASEAPAPADPEKAAAAPAASPRKRWSVAGSLSLALVAVMGGAIALKPELADQLVGGGNGSVGGVVSSASVAQPERRAPLHSPASAEPMVKEKAVSGADAPVNQAMNQALEGGRAAPAASGSGVALKTVAPGPAESGGKAQARSDGSSPRGRAAEPVPVASSGQKSGPAEAKGGAPGPGVPGSATAGAVPQGPASRAATQASFEALRQLHEYLDNGKDAMHNYDYALAAQQLEAAREIARDLGDIETLNWLRTALGKVYMQRGELIMRESLVTWQDCQMAREYFLKAQSLGFTGTKNIYNIQSAELCTNRRPGEKGR